jgi:hypothetical protein
MTRQAVQTLALVGSLLLGSDASVTLAQSPQPTEDLWLRVMGSSEELHVAVALSVEEASELSSAELALDEGSAVQAMGVCPSDEDGHPDLSSLQTLGTISSVASQGTYELEPGTPPILDEGEWWLVATFEGTGQPEASVSRLAFYEAEDGPRVLLGDGESPWGTVIGLVPQLTAELSPTTVSKARHAAEGSETQAKPIVARYLEACTLPSSSTSPSLPRIQKWAYRSPRSKPMNILSLPDITALLPPRPWARKQLSRRLAAERPSHPIYVLKLTIIAR